MKNEDDLHSQAKEGIWIVFSDLDGTLVHYPDHIPLQCQGTSSILTLPPTTTGLKGVISSQTLALVQQIRQQGIKFVLITGARTPTLLKRMPYLPRADAYCTEGGGRIFYPTTIDASSEQGHEIFQARSHHYETATVADLEPFGLVEDKEWRRRMQEHTGTFGNTNLKDLVSSHDRLATLDERKGILWDFARELRSKGYILDTKGYSTCFRVNRKHQKPSATEHEFQALQDGRLPPWKGLATSVNLSCVDFYPVVSGKKNACQYLAESFFPLSKELAILSEHAVCLCDDDNDLEMALACHHAFIPGVSSQSMSEVIDAHPHHFTRTEEGRNEGDLGVGASELALTLVLDQLRNNI